ncbi:MAG: multidrug transporter [Desulfovibrio sp.]|nr:multidrug transporter [Desulfovibrio sp.]|tara:strand:- start:12874 stop:13806 length:933 start_codon:yes stop_codon:yes gene_type:complete
MPTSLLPSIYLVLAMVIVGSSVVAGKVMTDELPVFLASLMRFAIALILLLPILFIKEGGFPRLSRRSWGILAGQSLCGSFLFTVFLLYGLKYTSSADAGIITATTPACMGLLALLILRDRPSLKSGAGILFSVAGVMVINTIQTDAMQSSLGSLTGNLLVLAAVFFEALFLLIPKSIREPLSPLATSTIISLFGMLWFLPMGIWELWHIDLTTISIMGWMTVAYYGAVVTVLAYLFWFAGIRQVAASRAGVFTAVMPVSAVLLSALVLDAPISWQQWLGCSLVLAGIVCTTTPSSNRKPAHIDNIGQPEQ